MNQSRSDRWPAVAWLVGLLAMTLIAGVVVFGGGGDSLEQQGHMDREHSSSGLADLASSTETPATPETPAAALPTVASPRQATTEAFPVLFRRPTGPPVIELTEPDPQGRSGTVACSTCHSIREPNLANRKPADLDQFHQSMQFAHGELACYSCHNPADADTLHLADGSVVTYPDLMKLCAQCHGSQARDYQHGAHGGMSGHWDLSRGPRTRNHCIDCHDPHVPRFPSMKPTFKPKDRFLGRQASPLHAQTGGESDE